MDEPEQHQARRFPRLPPLRYGALSAITLMWGVLTLAFSTLASSDLVIHWFDIVLGLFLLAATVALWFVGPRMGTRDWTPDIVVLGSAILIGVGTTLVFNGQSQLVLSLAVMLFAVYAGYFRPWNRFIVELVTLLLAYSIGLWVNPLLDSVLFYIAVAIATCAVSLMVAQQANLLRERATVDPLTGLLNRRGLETASGRTVALAGRRGWPVSLVALDMDGLKTINDTSGHKAGDAAIRILAREWNAGLRRGDLMARIGGDEFVVVLPDADLEQARDLVLRMRGLTTVAWSAGISAWRTDQALPEALAQADEELYRNKALRRQAEEPPTFEI